MLLVRDVRMLDGRITDLYVSDGVFVSEGDASDEVIDAKRLLAVPGLCNTHTHAAMTLLRGVGEGMELDRWLNEAIWPLEGRMKRRHIEAGMRLACLEMIRTGTTLFNDMYFMEDEMAPILRDIGIRAVLGEGLIDGFDMEKLEREQRRIPGVNAEILKRGGGLVMPSMSPHAVYTVSQEGLRWSKEEADRIGSGIHIHASETEKEVHDWIERTGRTPVRYLDDLGLLQKNTVLAHAVHLSDEDISLIAKRGASVSFNAISNMKLASGGPMRFRELADAGANVTIGTDGAASNNSLDMFQAMKVSSLLVRNRYGASSVPPGEILRCATVNGYRALGIKGGLIEEGYAADMLLVDPKHYSMTPGHDLISNIVHSISSEAVRFSMVNGVVLMKDGYVPDAESMVEMAQEAAMDLIQEGV